MAPIPDDLPPYASNVRTGIGRPRRCSASALCCAKQRPFAQSRCVQPGEDLYECWQWSSNRREHLDSTGHDNMQSCWLSLQVRWERVEAAKAASELGGGPKRIAKQHEKVRDKLHMARSDLAHLFIRTASCGLRLMPQLRADAPRVCAPCRLHAGMSSRRRNICASRCTWPAAGQADGAGAAAGAVRSGQLPRGGRACAAPLHRLWHG